MCSLKQFAYLKIPKTKCRKIMLESPGVIWTQQNHSEGKGVCAFQDGTRDHVLNDIVILIFEGFYKKRYNWCFREDYRKSRETVQLLKWRDIPAVESMWRISTKNMISSNGGDMLNIHVNDTCFIPFSMFIWTKKRN